MDTIADRLLARTGDTNPGLVAGDGSWTWDEVVEASRARAAWLRPTGPRAPSTWPSSSTTFPSSPSGWGRRPWPGPSPSAPTPPTAAPIWPATWPTPAASSSSPTRPSPPGRRTRSRPRPRRGLDFEPPGPRGRRSRPACTPRRHRWSLRPPLGRAVEEDALGYLIFTSGTSGAPKACRCTQGRLARIGAAVAQIYEITPDDVCYVAMPLFHSNALMAGWSPTLAAGATLALPTGGRFSASGSSPTSVATASPTSTTWANPSPTSWPPPSIPTTPTTP
jgi:fatty-acyl-CoA synthase